MAGPVGDVEKLYSAGPCPPVLEALDLLGVSLITIGRAVDLVPSVPAWWRTDRTGIPDKHFPKLVVLLSQALVVARAKARRLPNRPRSVNNLTSSDLKRLDHADHLRWRLARAEAIFKRLNGRRYGN